MLAAKWPPGARHSLPRPFFVKRPSGNRMEIFVLRRTVFLAAACLMSVQAVSARQHKLDTEKSTLTNHVGKTGAFSGLGHQHEVRAPIHSGTVDAGSLPAVEIRVDASQLRVIEKDASEKERAEVQKTMVGPEVLDSERLPEIVFKSTNAEATGQGRWTLHGNVCAGRRGRSPCRRRFRRATTPARAL
jgi:polyisoprenoid-binding protein YceI